MFCLIFIFFFLFLFFLLFSSYTCMRVWSRKLNDRLYRVFSSSLENMVEEDNQSLYNENNENNRVRTLRDYMNSTRTSARLCMNRHLFFKFGPLFVLSISILKLINQSFHYVIGLYLRLIFTIN